MPVLRVNVCQCPYFWAFKAQSHSHQFLILYLHLVPFSNNLFIYSPLISFLSHVFCSANYSFQLCVSSSSSFKHPEHSVCSYLPVTEKINTSKSLKYFNLFSYLIAQIYTNDYPSSLSDPWFKSSFEFIWLCIFLFFLSYSYKVCDDIYFLVHGTPRSFNFNWVVCTCPYISF